MKIALVQFKVSSDRAANLERGVSAFREAAGNGADLVVFPELAFMPFFPQKPALTDPVTWAETVPGPTTERFSQLAREHQTAVVLNLYEVEGEQRYDSSPVIDSDGTLLGVTRMIHILEAPCFHETQYYTPGDRGAPIFQTSVGRIGVAICYDRHFPEYMRALGVGGAELVVVPQAGSVAEWPEGVFEAEMQIASFQNGYFTALANRVGEEECLTFAGESFVTAPDGRVIARAPQSEDHILYAEIDLAEVEASHARRHFLRDRRPELGFYRP